MPKPERRPGPVLTLGGFDGVHLGHRQIIARTRDLARRAGAPAALLTYEPLPAQLTHPDFTYVLTPLAEKVLLFAELGIETVHVVRFDDALRLTGPEEFVDREVLGLSPSAVVVGHDHRFGCRGEGDVELLRRRLTAGGARLEVVPEIEVAGGPVRSTRIRERLLLGDVGRAAELLGRPYRLEGQVASGTGTGRRLGFPTLNLVVGEREKLVPADGVYAVRVELDGREHPGLLNIGHRPTFRGERRTVEAHLLDVRLDRPPARAAVLFLVRLRPERKFPDPGALARQIAADADRARGLFAGRGQTLDSPHASKKI